jgi:signal transduction histidine kinase
MTKAQDDIEKLKSEIEALRADNKALLKLASHDMRSPLNKVFALVNLLKMTDDPFTEEQQGYLVNIEQVLSDGLNRMRNLMDLLAIENDQLTVNWEKLDIAALVNKLAREHQPLAFRKKIKITSAIESVRSMSDRLIFARILEQLLSNAIKFSPEKSVIVVELSQVAEKFLLSVTDGGYGIAEEEQKSLFEKFKVLSTPVTGGESKSGLGLYIAQQNAMKLGGKISYSNVSGSRFTLELPCVQLA